MPKPFGSISANREGRKVDGLDLDDRKLDQHKDRRAAEEFLRLARSESDTVLTMKFLLGISVKLESVEEKAKRMDNHLSKITEISECLADMKERMAKLENSVSLLRVDNLMMFLSNIDKTKGQEMKQAGECFERSFLPKQEKKPELYNFEYNYCPDLKGCPPEVRKAERRTHNC